MMGRTPRKARLLSPEPAEVGRPFFVNESDAPDPPPEDQVTPESAVEEALAQGYQDGLARAEQELASEVEAFRAEAQASLKRIADYEKTFAAEHETKMLELALAVASRIVRQRIESGDDVAANALADALEAVPDSTAVRARVHADDLESMLEGNHEAVEAGRIELVADPSISRGGVILETDLGRIDASIETAERAAHEAVLETEEAP